jgi:hypothetical protein
LAGRLVVQAARAFWELHHEGQPARMFPPDRYMGVFCCFFLFFL